jgi:hypothetical protein
MKEGKGFKYADETLTTEKYSCRDGVQITHVRVHTALEYTAKLSEHVIRDRTIHNISFTDA